MHGGEDERDPLVASRIAPRTLALLTLLAVLPLYLLLGALVQVLHPGYGVWFTQVFIFLGAAFVLVRLSGRHPWRWPGLAPFRAAPAAWGFSLGLVNFFAVIIPLQFLAQLVFPTSWVEAADASNVFRDRSPVEVAMLALGVTIAAPLGEEYFFRGVLQNAAHEARVRARNAIFAIALVFSALHLDAVGFAARVELGLLFGWLFWRTGSLWPAVFAHAANNLVTATLYFASRAGKLEETEPKTAAEGALEVALVAAAGLAVLGALLWFPRRSPRLARPAEAPPTSVVPAGLYATAAPWLVAALLSFSALMLVERRTVALNWFDLGHPLPHETKLPEDEVAELRALRDRARRGELPLDAYEVEREAMQARHGDGRRAPPLPDVLPLPPVPELPEVPDDPAAEPQRNR